MAEEKGTAERSWAVVLVWTVCALSVLYMIGSVIMTVASRPGPGSSLDIRSYRTTPTEDRSAGSIVTWLSTADESGR